MAFAMDYTELEELYAKAGGKFRLTVLLQRRVNELVRGAPRLVKLDKSAEKDYIRIALEELKQNMISLAPDDETLRMKKTE